MLADDSEETRPERDRGALRGYPMRGSLDHNQAGASSILKFWRARPRRDLWRLDLDAVGAQSDSG